jgi:hypothetical protein
MTFFFYSSDQGLVWGVCEPKGAISAFRALISKFSVANASAGGQLVSTNLVTASNVDAYKIQS